MDLPALLFLRASVTDIGRLVQRLTGCRIKLRTQCLTVVFLTEFTSVSAAVYGFSRAQVLPQTILISGTAVRREPVTVSGKGTVILHFP